MTTLTTDHATGTGAPAATDEAIRQALLKQVELKLALGVEGLSFAVSDIKRLPIGTEYAEQIHHLFDYDKAHHADLDLPGGFYLPSGLFVAFRWDPDSRYRLTFEDGQPAVTRDNEPLTTIDFCKRPEILNFRTSRGETFERIAIFTPEGGIFLVYSNECSLKATGEDCLYCNINATAGAYRNENIFIKTPQQVGEVYATAYHAGLANHINVTGGFIPERRELDYYVDVAEEIKERTGQDQFTGTAVVGAPLDLSSLEKYKEAGYSNISLNIEIWDKDIFKAICPGKEKRCGGWENWVRALEYSVEIFGRGNVRSLIVAGIEPKQSILEGLEYLISRGVICLVSPWIPNPGSALEGHRSPEVGWHYDVTLKNAAILKKYGYTTQQIYNCYYTSSAVHDVFRINAGEFVGEFLPQWTFPLVNKP